MSEPLFGIDELVAEADARVAAAGIEAPNGAVAEALTVRNVRYYATLGLLAPPAARRGRHALYDATHVDQLVAVKRLQGAGLQLAEVQRALVGLAPDEVARIAADEAVPAERFWAARGAASTEAAPRDVSVAAASSPIPAAPLAAAVTPPPYPSATVYALGEGISLQVPAGTALSPAAATRVLDAARAVLLPSSPPTAPDAPLHPLIAPKTGAHPQEHRR